jgi:dTMP kinase
MDERRGIFIAIEGSDGSGKTTQSELIKRRLEAAGHEVETFDFPQYDQPSSYFVKRYLEGGYGQLSDVGPYTSSLFYALDRFEAAPKIRQALKEGKVVISNRFTGSSMAHQGTKIANAEQRRGYFIWLDNLEFEMLRIPRPNISFVLRVPADISKQLMSGRKKQDIHEADQTHLKLTVEVYDDLTQLFPKDFQRIDCVRGGQLLDIEAVNAMVWEKISPLLPEPAPRPNPAKKPDNPPAAADIQTTTAATTEPPTKELVIESASGLLAQKVERLLPSARLEQPDIPTIFTPTNLIPAAREDYEAQMNTVLGLYAKLVAGLAKRGVSAPEARTAAQLALPVALAVTIRIDANDPNLEELIIYLLNDTLPEAQAAGAQLLAQAVQLGLKQFKTSASPVKRMAPVAVKALAAEFLAENHISDPVTVQLSSVWPRNELDLIADMLYEHSGLPLRTIQERVAGWPMSRKLAVLEAYLGDDQPGSVLEKAHYSWDLTGPYAAFRELQRSPAENLAIQPLTPRFGYDIPALVEEADLAETFEKCGDLSLKLYSSLQQAGHLEEAQYATLFAHKQRWQMTMNARQMRTLYKSSDATLSSNLLQEMRDKLAVQHPTLSDFA